MLVRALHTIPLALVTSLTLMGGPADAARLVQPDRTEDVWSPDGPRDFSQEGSVVNTDLEGTTVRHREHSIVIKADYVNLKKRVSDEIVFHAHVRTNDVRHFDLFVHVDSRGRGVYPILVKGKHETRVECDAMKGHAGFAANTLRVMVPRECLDGPRWVRYQGSAESYEESAGLFIDNANGRGPEPKRWSRKIVRGVVR